MKVPYRTRMSWSRERQIMFKVETMRRPKNHPRIVATKIASEGFLSASGELRNVPIPALWFELSNDFGNKKNAELGFMRICGLFEGLGLAGTRTQNQRLKRALLYH